jgi:hypothetical protein
VNRIVCIAVFSLFFTSCKKDNPLSYSAGKDIEDFFGMKIGNISFFDVTYMYHDDQVDRHDTIKLKIKSIIEDTFRDNENNLRYLIHRYRWNDTIGSWVNHKVLSAYSKDLKNIQVEDNISEIKIFNPIMIGFKWQSNVYNDLDTLKYQVSNRYTNLNFNNILFKDVIDVQQQVYFTYVDLKRKHEYYAKDIGLIYKVYKDLKIKKGDTLKVDRGVELYYTYYQSN